MNLSPKASFSWTDVPAELRQLIPYAVIWGLSDDWARQDLMKRTPAALKRNLKWVVQQFDNQLDAWLAGPEAAGPTHSKAYIAFSAMRMGADFV